MRSDAIFISWEMHFKSLPDRESKRSLLASSTRKPKTMTTKKVNIYLDAEMRKRMKALQKKYHVSLSTCVQVIADNMITIYKQIDTEREKIILHDSKKTSIKPKLQYADDVINSIDPRSKNWILTSCIYIYSHDLIYSYYTKDAGSQIKQKIHNELFNKKESYYNYNEQLRNNVRMAKDPNFMKYMEKLGNARKSKTTNG